MGIEIERKYLLKDDRWRDEIVTSEVIEQAYLCGTNSLALRILITGNKALLGLKSSQNGIHRHEYEYAVPLSDAESMIQNICTEPPLRKTRHRIYRGELCWEIDEFSGDNQGLIVAEIELDNVNQVFEKPEWLGDEISTDTRYYNNNLFAHPYKNW